VRGALHRAIRARGQDPTVLDPWYFPSAEHYEKVCPIPCSIPLGAIADLICVSLDT